MGQPQKLGNFFGEFPTQEEEKEEKNPTALIGVVPDFFIYSIIMLRFFIIFSCFWFLSFFFASRPGGIEKMKNQEFSLG